VTNAVLEQLQNLLAGEVKARKVQPSLKPLPGIKNIIAVASGKGGVGKSTTTVNLALCLARAGAKVGVLDADIYGPNQPLMLGVSGKQPVVADGKLVPLERFGMPTMSMGYLVEESAPMVWRGPMVTQALKQLLFDTQWPELDFLLIDMPPGTGDVQLTLAKRIPVAGAVIVTTPQDVAVMDARKAIEMFNKVDVPVLGVVQNMSMHTCSECGHQEALFGEAGGEQLAKDCAVPLLGQLPLSKSIREQADLGRPIVDQDPDGPLAAAYFQFAVRLVEQWAGQAIEYCVKFPNIVVETKE
jgi:ATP-binding protein involved in chromosome partitioning